MILPSAISFLSFCNFFFDNRKVSSGLYSSQAFKIHDFFVILKNFFSIRLINFLKCKRFVSYIFIIVSPFFSLHNKNLYPIILIYSLRTYKFPVILLLLNFCHFSPLVHNIISRYNDIVLILRRFNDA